MKALSVRQPFAWLICNGTKDVENRSRGTKHRGPILIHAGKQLADRTLLEDAIRLAESWHDVKVPPELPVGGIVGMATVSKVVEESDSAWFDGPMGYVLTSARHLPFKACKGRLGLFEVKIDPAYLESKSPRKWSGKVLPEVPPETGDRRYVWRL